MAASMEQESIDAEGQRPPLISASHATGDTPNWSTRPFAGSPNTTFTVSSSAGFTSAANLQAGPPPPSTLSSSGPDGSSGFSSPHPLLEDFLAYYEHYSIVTNLLMIGHLPLNITHDEFRATMDKIQTQLSVPVINNYYDTAEFGLGFSPAAGASWTNEGFTYPNEHHCSYFLRLAGPLPFGCTGQLDEELRPLVFTSSVVFADPHKTSRQLLVQPVPHDFRESLLRPPVAVWRGIGTEIRDGGGGPTAALALISLYIQHVAAERKRQDPNQDWQYHSFLSLHQVTVRPPPRPPLLPEQRRRGRDRSRTRTSSGGHPGNPETPSAPAGPVQVQYLELFVLTVCSAPASDLDNCFAGLIPPPAPFNLPCFPISLCGWWVELASGLDPFTSNGGRIGPSLELLIPCPTARINGLRPGAAVSNIMRAIATEGQDRRRLLCGYLDRSPDGGNSCVLLTDGKRIMGTAALRAWSPSMVLHLTEDMDDLRRLRDRYQIFRRSLGLSLTAPTRPPLPSPPLACTLTRTTPAPGNLSYCEVARVATLPEGDVQALVATTVKQQIATISAALHSRFEALESTQDKQNVQVARLTSDQEELRHGLRETNAGLDATQAIVEVHAKAHQDIHAFMTAQSQFIVDHERRMKSIESHLQTLAKRRSPDSGLSPGGPRGPADPSETDA